MTRALELFSFAALTAAALWMAWLAGIQVRLALAEGANEDLTDSCNGPLGEGQEEGQ